MQLFNEFTSLLPYSVYESLHIFLLVCCYFVTPQECVSCCNSQHGPMGTDNCHILSLKSEVKMSWVSEKAESRPYMYLTYDQCSRDPDHFLYKTQGEETNFTGQDRPNCVTSIYLFT